MFSLQDIPLKQRIFADLEAVCRPDAILASNTSTIDISLIGKNTRASDRIVGAHFFSPAHVMPLLEIVRTADTSKQVDLASPCAAAPTCHCTRTRHSHPANTDASAWALNLNPKHAFQVCFRPHNV